MLWFGFSLPTSCQVAEPTHLKVFMRLYFTNQTVLPNVTFDKEIHLYVADDAALVTVCRVLVTDHTSVVSVALVQVLVVAGIVVVVVRQLYNIWYGQVVQFKMVQVPEETLSKVSSF